MARRRFDTKKQAADALAQARVDNARGTAILPAESRVTVSAYADRWMATLQVRPSTRAMYASHLKVHIRPLLGHRPLSSLRRSDIAAFVAQLCDRGLKPSTVRGTFNVLAMILRAAVYDRLLPVSPCYRIKVPAVTRRSLEVFTPQQVHALLDAVWDCDRAVLATAVGTGLRQGEVLGLRLTHVNLLRRELAVEEQAMTPPQGQPYITRELKTAASRRVVPLPQFVIHAVARHLEVYGAGPDGEVFLNRRGLVWRRGSFNDSVWKPTLRRAGLPEGLRLPRPTAHVRLRAHRAEPAPARDPGEARPQVDHRDDGHLRASVPGGLRRDDEGVGPALRATAARRRLGSAGLRPR